MLIRATNRRAFIAALGGAVAWPLTGSGQDVAQTWPTRPLRAIVPFTAGSAVDVLPRMVFEALSGELGQSIIVENRTGAGGTIGTAAVAKADPGGYTILVNSSSHTVVPTLYPNAPFNTVRDFSGVIPLGSLPNVLVVAPSKGFKSLGDLVAAAKAKPGSITYASAGIGSGTHFRAERLRLSAGFEGVHVPFRGAPEAYTEVMTGRVDFFFGALASALPFIRNGKLLALAVSSPQRTSSLPEVPTTLEAGYPNSDYTFWVAVFAPAKTPKGIVEKLYQKTLKTLQSTNLPDKLATFGVEPMVLTSAELDALVKREIAANADVVKAANIRIE
jgi:tripartite-type tricarboxylate transporter receptor subunit TctC